mmetsp:Transcript_8456/g.33420  ORF Transcript_8456/g.33420 Transcript_8456/m.33420 type:complete len:374 (-) Transcript_8456:860-1981(-)
MRARGRSRAHRRCLGQLRGRGLASEAVLALAVPSGVHGARSAHVQVHRPVARETQRRGAAPRRKRLCRRERRRAVRHGCQRGSNADGAISSGSPCVSRRNVDLCGFAWLRRWHRRQPLRVGPRRRQPGARGRAPLGSRTKQRHPALVGSAGGFVAQHAVQSHAVVPLKATQHVREPFRQSQPIADVAVPRLQLCQPVLKVWQGCSPGRDGCHQAGLVVEQRKRVDPPRNPHKGDAGLMGVKQPQVERRNRFPLRVDANADGFQESGRAACGGRGGISGRLCPRLCAEVVPVPGAPEDGVHLHPATQGCHDRAVAVNARGGPARQQPAAPGGLIRGLCRRRPEQAGRLLRGCGFPRRQPHLGAMALQLCHHVTS